MNLKKGFWIVFTLCLCYSTVFNIVNFYLVKTYPTSTYHIAENNITLWSPDNEYYLDPVDNYMAGNGWRRNPPLGKGSYYRRTPGYSILYLTAAKLTNNTTSKFHVLIFFQILLFSFSLYCIWGSVKILTNSKAAIYSIVLIFGISPILNSALLLTITEALFPNLIIFFIYWTLKAYYCSSNYNQAISNYMIASLFISLSILTRPVTGILVLCLVIPYFIFMLSRRAKYYSWFSSSLLVSLPALILVSSWGIRNYMQTGDVVLLEVAFHPESHDRMKPEFKGLFSFVKSWGEDGAAMNEWQLPLFQKAILRNDTSVIYVKNAVNTFPKYVVEYFGRKRLETVLIQYQHTVYSQKKYYDKGLPMPSVYSKMQIQSENSFNELTAELSRAFPFQYYVVAPFKYLIRSVVHSNTANVYLFQEPFRQYKILVLLRLALLVLNASAYATIIYNAWYFKNDIVRFFIFCVIPVLYVMFFVLYFKEIEQRYLLPALILAFIGLYNPIANIESFVEKKILK